MRKLYEYIKSFFSVLSNDNVTVYSAYAAFYMIISFVPFLMMFLMIAGHFVSISPTDFSDFVGKHLPGDVVNIISTVIDEILHSDSVSLISIPVVTLIWTASRSVVAIAKGLDAVYKVENKRGFIKLNLYGMFYTFIFFVAILFSLLLMVFGNLIADALSVVFPFAIEIIDKVLSARSIISIIVLTLFFVCVYKFIPGRKLKFSSQIPGAIFSASGWMIFSLFFSVYVDNFYYKSYVYGSLTALIIFMLWVYFCMIIMMLGGEINYFLAKEKGDIDK
ncbi:MAG: YihY/virulence factor BrkB family protein [Clostridia bacterium]|nr:YihY/virulence factor BrkB family protein [Clostridia bacterium]